MTNSKERDFVLEILPKKPLEVSPTCKTSLILNPFLNTEPARKPLCQEEISRDTEIVSVSVPLERTFLTV